MNRSPYLQSSAWLCVCRRRDYRFLSFLVLDCRLQERKKGLNLIHFLTWRETRTKNLKTTEFLELCGRVLSLIFSRYVSDSIWTIVKISWRGIYAKSFRVRQSSVDTRLVDFLENRNAFLLLLVEICANVFSFSGRARTSTLGAFAFSQSRTFSGSRVWFHYNTLQIDVMFKTWIVTNREVHAPFDCSFAEGGIVAIWSVCALFRTCQTVTTLLTSSWPYLNFCKPPFLGVKSWILSARLDISCLVYQ
jgi:hypothetical protein